MRSAGPAAAPVRALSLCGYLCTAWLGVRGLALPWASGDAATGRIAAAVGALYTLQYLVEALLAMAGRLTLHAWRADEVLAHHLSVGLVMAPAYLGCFLYSPDDWVALLAAHPPAATVIASAAITGLNEAGFVLRSFAPARLADAPAVRWAQSVLTLLMVLQNVVLTQAGCALGAWTLVPSLWGQGEARLAAVPVLQRAVLAATYPAGPAFFVLVQASYLLPNWRKVAAGPRGSPRWSAAGAPARWEGGGAAAKPAGRRT